jgi:hypothetical protein
MALKAAAKFTQSSFKFFHWRIAAVGHYCIKHRANVAIGKHNTIAIGPSRILRIVLELVKI